MKLLEFQGKGLYKYFGIPTTEFVFLGNSLSESDYINAISLIPGDEIVLKTQILSGKRGKRGGVKIVPKKDSYEYYKNLVNLDLGETNFGVLAERKIEIEKEFYLSLLVDRSLRDLRVIFSEHGGVDIEEVPKEFIKSFPVSSLSSSEFGSFLEANSVFEIAKKLLNLSRKRDCLLVEINPLVVTKGGEVIAADSKIVIDDNALFRNSDIENYEMKEIKIEIENKARKEGLAFVNLGGDIGVISNGAGLTMATVDYIYLVTGGKPANFLDIGGGAKKEKITLSIEIVNSLGPKVIWINIFGGITDCMEVALGILDFINKNPNSKTHLVARIMGTNEDKARELLLSREIPCFKDMKESSEFIKNLLL